MLCRGARLDHWQMGTAFALNEQPESKRKSNPTTSNSDSHRLPLRARNRRGSDFIGREL